jgi:hypothetical protein
MATATAGEGAGMRLEFRLTLDDYREAVRGYVRRNRGVAFTTFAATPNPFLLYQSDRIFRVLPKRAFAGDARTAEFRDLLRRRLPA